MWDRIMDVGLKKLLPGFVIGNAWVSARAYDKSKEWNKMFRRSEDYVELGTLGLGMYGAATQRGMLGDMSEAAVATAGALYGETFGANTYGQKIVGQKTLYSGKSNGAIASQRRRQLTTGQQRTRRTQSEESTRSESKEAALEF